MSTKLAAAVAVLVLAIAGCGSSGTPKSSSSPADSATPAATSLSVTQKEFALGVSAGTVRSGSVPITVTNNGTIEHEFVAFKTELAETDLPLVADGSRIDEKGSGITHLDPEAEDVKPNTSKSITIVFAPGRYVLVCNLPAHYKQGMHVVLTAV
jgi:uncharacterized cupredoxin-like copper-binding protein